MPAGIGDDGDVEPVRPDQPVQPEPGTATPPAATATAPAASGATAADAATATGAVDPAAGASEEHGAPPPRGRGRTPLDMVRSMVVILALVFVVVWLLPRPNGIEQPPVDVRSAATAAASTLPFEPVVPAALPQGWKPTSAYSRRSTDDVITWHIGYLTPEGKYAGVEMAADATPKWVQAQTAAPRPTDAGSRTVGGVEWEELYRQDRNRSTLKREADGITTLVTGGAGFDELSVLAEAVLAGEPVAAAPGT